MTNKLKLTQADITTLDPETVDTGSDSILTALNQINEGVGQTLKQIEDELSKPGISDSRKQELRQLEEKTKSDIRKFQNEYSQTVGDIGLKRERLTAVYKELYRKYSPVLPESPQYAKQLIYTTYPLADIKTDINLVKDKYLDAIRNGESLQSIITKYQSEKLNLKLYFREELVKFERLIDKYFTLLVNMLDTIIASSEAIKKLGASEKYKDFLELNDSLSDIKSLAREHYKLRQEKFMQAGLSKERIMEKQSKYFNLFQQSDLSGGFWNLDKEAGKIKALDKSRKAIESEKDETMDMIKKALKDGGVWKYSIGETVAVDSDFGFVLATIEKLLPESNYLLKNDSHFKDGITVSESQIFDTKDTI